MSTKFDVTVETARLEDLIPSRPGGGLWFGASRCGLEINLSLDCFT